MDGSIVLGSNQRKRLLELYRKEPDPLIRLRAHIVLLLADVFDQPFDEIAKIVTQENGKTLDEARGSFKRGIENVEHACGTPALMKYLLERGFLHGDDPGPEELLPQDLG